MMNNENTRTLYTVTGLDTEGYPDAYNVWANDPADAKNTAQYLGLETIWDVYPFEDNFIGLDDDSDEEEED